MPVYGDSPESASAGRANTVWDAETVTVPSSSVSVGLRREESFPSCLSAEVRFAAAPGVFAVDLQTADTDEEEYYVTKATLSAVNATHVGRLELTNVVAKFARLRMVTRTNSTAVTAKIF